VKKILGLAISALLVIGMVAAGTFAYFTDTQASSGNVFTAGTLDLGLSNTPGAAATGDVTGTFTATTWKPGDTATGTLSINNAGSIAMGHLTVAFTYTLSTAGRPLTISGSPWTTDPTDLFDKEITVTTATWNGVTQDGTSGSATIQGRTLAQLQTTGAIQLATLGANTKHDLVLIFTFATGATNGCQGNVLTLTVTFNGTQN
jgi:predicted ribosomally synthesized peptide with SipW-like signal peptide